MRLLNGMVQIKKRRGVLLYRTIIITASMASIGGTLSFDVTGLITEPEATTTINNNDPNNAFNPDCLLWTGTVLAVETEAPNYDFSYYIPVIGR